MNILPIVLSYIGYTVSYTAMWKEAIEVISNGFGLYCFL